MFNPPRFPKNFQTVCSAFWRSLCYSDTSRFQLLQLAPPPCSANWVPTGRGRVWYGCGSLLVWSRAVNDRGSKNWINDNLLLAAGACTPRRHLSISFSTNVYTTSSHRGGSCTEGKPCRDGRLSWAGSWLYTEKVYTARAWQSVSK